MKEMLTKVVVDSIYVIVVAGQRQVQKNENRQGGEKRCRTLC